LKPPQEVLTQFEKIARPIFDKQFNISKQSNELRVLRDWLLPMLMTGQATVKDKGAS
jgi:type I restriction enzyme S subunit